MPTCTMDAVSYMSEHYNANLQPEVPSRKQPAREIRGAKVQSIYDEAQKEADNPNPEKRGRTSNNSNGMDVDQQQVIQYGAPNAIGGI